MYVCPLPPTSPLKVKSKSIVTQSCPTLFNPMDCSPPAFSVSGILRAGILEWVAMPSSRGSSRPRDQTQVSRMAGRFFTIGATPLGFHRVSDLSSLRHTADSHWPFYLWSFTRFHAALSVHPTVSLLRCVHSLSSMLSSPLPPLEPGKLPLEAVLDLGPGWPALCPEVSEWYSESHFKGRLWMLIL